MNVRIQQLFKAMLVVIMASSIAACETEPDVEEYLASGQQFVEKAEWKSAIIEFKNAVKQDPDNARARAMLGKAYIETDSANAAIKELVRAIQLGYNKSELIVPLGLAYRQAGDMQKVIDDILPGEASNVADKAVVHSLRAIAYLKQGKERAAKLELDNARKLDGEGIEVRLAWATYEGLNGDIDAQQRWLQPLLELDGGVAEAWSQMAEIERNRGDWKAAEEAYTRAIDIRITPHLDYINRALLRIELGDIEGARSDIDFLNKAGANWPIVGYAEGLIDFSAESYDEALAHFLDVLSKAPDHSASQYWAGVSYMLKQNYRSGIPYFESYLGSNSENSQAQFFYAVSLVGADEAEKAIGVLETLRQTDPSNSQVLLLLSDAYLRVGKDADSLDALSKSVRSKPDQAVSRMFLGTSLMRSPETMALGQAELRRALELNPDLRQAKFHLYVSHMQQQQYDAAMRIATEFEIDFPEDSFGANLVAATELARGQPDSARKKLISTLEKFPGDFLTSHTLGRIYIADQAYGEARALYLKVLEKNPSHLRSLQQMAFLSGREGNAGDMIQWLQKAADRNPDQTEPKLQLASQYLQTGNHGEAIKVLNDVDVEDKESLIYIVLMSRAKIAAGEYDHAFRLAYNLTKRVSESSIGHFLLAQVYSAQEKPDKMRDSLEKTVELAPDNLTAHVVLAELDLAEGKTTAFEQRLALLEQRFPGSVQVELLKARQSAVREDYGNAIKSLSRLMEDTALPDVAIELARNQWQAGDRQDAISGLELWLQKNNDNRVLLQLGEYYLLDDQAANATRIYEQLDRALPNNPVILNNLAMSLKDANPAKGVEYARQADRTSPGNPLILDTLAMLLLAAGEIDQALETSERAIDKAPGLLELQLNHAEILVAKGDKDKARRFLEGSLRKTRDPADKQIIQSRLEAL